jgi:hypothetical protein
MKNEEPQRNGSLADANLIADCRERAGSLRDHLPALTSEGLTAAQLDAFDALTDAFEQLPTDVSFQGTISVEREYRDVVLEACRTALRRAVQPIDRAYGNRSPQYKRFGVGEVSDKTVAEVLRLLRTVPDVGADFLADTKALAEGFGPDRLTALADLHEDLEKSESKLDKAENARLVATRTRVLAYNTLNTTCAGHCARGYDKFVETDATLAHLFVRDPASETPSAGPPLG